MIVEPITEVSTRMIDEWRTFVNAFPLPPHLTPKGGAPLVTVSDEALLSAPPHLITHIQRTAAQGGFQVVSPRQTPFSQMMVRRSGTKRELGDHDVGSIASPNEEWPTLDGFSFDTLLPDEPIAPLKEVQVVRGRTETHTLVKGGKELVDPVLSCLVTGRALIDILRRPDVAGGADEMARLLASAWSIPLDVLMEMDAYTIGIDGPLQRHAMRVDDVYPTIYAPVQYKSVISMGTSDVSKELLPIDTAIDWRRARVFCEAVFYNCCVLEGIPIKRIGGPVAPGDPGSLANKPGTLTFSIAPATAWTYAPSTFSIFPSQMSTKKKPMALPPEVRDALQRYVTRVRPVSYLVAGGKSVDAIQSYASEVDQMPNETIRESYHVTMRSMMTGAVRGRTAVAAVRNAVYEAMTGAPDQIALRLTRYITLAPEECRTHLGISTVPDSVIDNLALRFQEVGSLIRNKVVQEAVRRGYTAEEWWEDMLAQVPARYQALNEGTMGWSKVGMWLAFKEPTGKWQKMKTALKWETLRSAEANAVGALALPAEKGSKERLHAVAEGTVRAMARAFAGHYQGVADVAYAVAAEAEKLNKWRTAAALTESAFLWTLRARTFRATNVHLIAHSEFTPSYNHFRIRAQPTDILVKPAPYKPYAAWLRHVEESQEFPHAVKKYFSKVKGSMISQHFTGLDRPLMVCKESVVTKYLTDPARLGRDMESAWGMLVADIRNAVNKFAYESTPKPGTPTTVETRVRPELLDISEYMARPPERNDGLADYYSVLAIIDPDEAEGIEDSVSKLPDWLREELMEGLYSGPDDLMTALMQAEGEHNVSKRKALDTVN